MNLLPEYLPDPDKIIAQIVEGELDPMQVAAQCKRVISVYESIAKDEEVKTRVINFIDENGERGEYKSYGFKFKRMSKKSYDFTVDSKWNKLAEDRKRREQLLKAIEPGQEIADTETGEVIGCCIKGESVYYTMTGEKR